jgi:hypothetical protein
MRISFVAIGVKRVPFDGKSVAAGLGRQRRAKSEEEGEMTALPRIRVWLACLILAVLAAAPPLRAEDAGAVPWQDVISSQIQAFRDHDAPAAFSYAGVAFQETFPNAETFFIAIIQSGYSPIMESSSHSFGAFRLIGDTGVMQTVKFIGKNQQFYEAIYQLAREPGGWRVQGVQLMQPSGVAI